MKSHISKVVKTIREKTGGLIHRLADILTCLLVSPRAWRRNYFIAWFLSTVTIGLDMIQMREVSGPSEATVLGMMLGLLAALFCTTFLSIVSFLIITVVLRPIGSLFYKDYRPKPQAKSPTWSELFVRWLSLDTPYPLYKKKKKQSAFPTGLLIGLGIGWFFIHSGEDE